MPIEGELAILIAETSANLSHLESITHGLTSQQFNWRAEPGRWSMAECIAHLVKVNGPDLAPLRQAVDDARARSLTGEGPFAYGFFSRKFVSSMEPPVTRKFKAPKYYIPPSDSPMDQTLAEYKRICAEFRQLVEKANGLDLRRVKATLPALPPPLRAIIKMPLGARLQLLVAHDRRHLWQAEQVRQHPDFPK